jgi:acetyl esterase/lipase
VRRLAGLLLLVALLPLAGCGDGSDLPDRPSVVGPIGKGPAGVWLFRPAGTPKNVVVYFHGQGGFREATPANHRPWIDHLVAGGSVVVYPRWELTYELDPMLYVLKGVQAAMKRVDADKLPVLAIGYSRGGALAVEYGAVAPGNGVPVPDQIMSIFPASVGNERRIVGLSTLDGSTRLLIQVGTDDTVVDGAGARALLQRLRAAGFPGENIQVDIVRSHAGFTADHFAPLRTSAGARAAFWQTADRLLDDLE